MAYTITILDGGLAKQCQVLNRLEERMHKEGIFRATLTPGVDSKGHCTIVCKPVRLIKKKSYCGNHPGECPVSSKPKPKAAYLEWDDWIKFHSLVNRTLNRFKTNADVWSTPVDVRGKMWIRKGTRARVNWDWTEHVNGYGQIVRDWNQGTEDQFQPIGE